MDAEVRRARDGGQRAHRALGLGPDVVDADLPDPQFRADAGRGGCDPRADAPDRRRPRDARHGLVDGTTVDEGSAQDRAHDGLGRWLSRPSCRSSSTARTRCDLAKWLFWIFIPAIYFYIGPCFGLLNNLCEPRMRAQFCAATLFVANVGNLIIAPQLVGFLSDAFAPDHVANGRITAARHAVPGARTALWAVVALLPVRAAHRRGPGARDGHPAGVARSGKSGDAHLFPGNGGNR